MRKLSVFGLFMALAAVFAVGAAYAAPVNGMNAMGDPLPMDMEMSVMSINGMKVMDGSNISMKFNSDGTLSGNASVNGFMSSWKMDGDKLMIMGASGMSTMMSGAPEMMDQEKKFLDAMPMITKYKVEGAKVMLSSDDGKTMMELAMPVTM